MAFPTVEAQNTSYEASDASTHTVNLPASIADGDLLIVMMAFDGADAPFVTFPGGYTEIFDVAGAASSLAAAYRYADGEEGATISVGTGTSRMSAHATYRISNHDSGNIPEISTSATGSGNTPDPDSLSPTGGSDTYLWIALYSQDGDAGTGPFDATAAPANYTDLINRTSGSATFGCTLGVARRELEADPEDPGTFTAEASSEEWIAATMAVYPSLGLTIAIVPTDSTYDIAKPVIVG